MIREGSSPGTGGYYVCMLCKGRVSVGSILNSSIDELPHSQNGSYILPNGVIVLVDADIEAYMNDTLVFYTGETQ